MIAIAPAIVWLYCNELFSMDIGLKCALVWSVVKFEEVAAEDLSLRCGHDIICWRLSSWFSSSCFHLLATLVYLDSYCFGLLFVFYCVLCSKMRPQSLLRPLGLLQHVSNRSFLPTGRRSLSSSSRVPDFAFAFEYVFLWMAYWDINNAEDMANKHSVSMAFSYDPPSPFPAQQTRWRC